MLKCDDRVKIAETGEIGYVAQVMDGGERVMVRVPSSTSWPFPSYVYLDKEKVKRCRDSKPQSLMPTYEPAPF
jgi:hypothetical protein